MARSALTGAVPGGGASGWLGGESPLHALQGEVLADGKGVPREGESEGSPRQNAGL